MRWLLTVLVLGMILGNPALAQGGDADESLNGLATSWPVTAEGDIQVRTDDFALRFDPTHAFHTFRLEADEIDITMEWKRGWAVGDGPPVSVVTERDSQRATLNNAELTIDRFQGEPIVFATASDEQASLSLRTTTSATWTSTQDVRVVTEGMSNNTQATNDEMELGFWYTAEGPTIEARTSGLLQLDGTFSLFLHDVEVHAEGDHGRQWSEWTGYREEDPALVAKQYEFRVTTVHVENGTLITTPSRPVEHYTTDLDIQVDGTVNAKSVTGRLVRASKTFLFKEEPLELEGSGKIGLKADQPSGGPRILLQPSEGLQVDNKRPLEDPETYSGIPLPSVLLLPLVALLLVTATTAGLSRTPPGRRLRHEAWSKRGEEAAFKGDWDRSSNYYRRAIRARPGVASTWHDLIQAELQSRNGHTAERLARQAAEVPGMDPCDLLALRAAAAWLRRDSEELHAHLEKLHETAPEMAQILAKSLQVELPHPPEALIDGYA